MLEALERRLEESAERRRRARGRALGLTPKRSVLERAADLVAGSKVDAANPADEIGAAHEEEKILRAAIGEASAKLDAVAREISFEASQRFKPVHDAALIAALRAVDELAVALDTAAAVRARLHGAG